MLTFEELTRELALHSYKPDWKLTLWQDERQGILLYIVTMQQDSYHPENDPIQLRISSWVPPMQTRRAFSDWLFWRITQIEIHEAMEWFKRRGFPVNNPHADLDPPMKEVERVWNLQKATALQSVSQRDPSNESA